MSRAHVSFFLFFLLLVMLPRAFAASCPVRIDSVLEVNNSLSILLTGDARSILEASPGVLVHASQPIIERVPSTARSVTLTTREGNCTLSLADAPYETSITPETPGEDVLSPPAWLDTLSQVTRVSASLLSILSQSFEDACSTARSVFDQRVQEARTVCNGLSRQDLEACSTAECFACQAAYQAALRAEENMSRACSRVTCQPVLTREAHAASYQDPVFGDTLCSVLDSPACEAEYVRVQQPRCPGFPLTTRDASQDDTSSCGIVKDPSLSFLSAFECQCYPVLEDFISTVYHEAETARSCWPSSGSACVQPLARLACTQAVLLLAEPCAAERAQSLANLICSDPLGPGWDMSRFALDVTLPFTFQLTCQAGNVSTPCACPLSEDLSSFTLCSPGEACTPGLGCTEAEAESLPSVWAFARRVSTETRGVMLPPGASWDWLPSQAVLPSPAGDVLLPAFEAFLGVRTREGILSRSGVFSLPSCVETEDFVLFTRDTPRGVFRVAVRRESLSFSLEDKRLVVRHVACSGDTPRLTLLSLSPS